MTRKFLLILAASVLLAACSKEPAPSAAEIVVTVANDFVDGYYSQFPEEVYEVGYPDAPPDRFGDHSQEALLAWNAKVDAWLDALDAVDASKLETMPEAVAYVFTRERLQSIVNRRICRMDLWNVSPTWTG